MERKGEPSNLGALVLFLVFSLWLAFAYFLVVKVSVVMVAVHTFSDFLLPSLPVRQTDRKFFGAFFETKEKGRRKRVYTYHVSCFEMWARSLFAPSEVIPSFAPIA